MAFFPTTQSEVQAWLQRFHSVNDSLDTSKIADIYAKDAKVQFGNMPVIEGLDGLRNFFGRSWVTLESMHHEIESFDMIENRIYQSCHITWQVKNDPEKEKVVVPAMAVIHLVKSGEEKGLINRAAYYMDGSPLKAVYQRLS
ncbi:uncharacterized protein GGS22DRAFT_187482 [Annulohypoxylon maeteangense]|uniref:uncharacterized protein n=1 Tax=Annulohypoxylon maeteangense TaxID=1927788 RepID=UPI002007CB18|nr:uncharacterized protein GGS22DRAFT_187482 [Annulohypoxylon maeteangense]KAI0886244.1 hypothetical protein GGS22DRAFT_187482 [Annulohypoxylon maeteangense]